MTTRAQTSSSIHKHPVGAVGETGQVLGLKGCGSCGKRQWPRLWSAEPTTSTQIQTLGGRTHAKKSRRKSTAASCAQQGVTKQCCFMSFYGVTPHRVWGGWGFALRQGLPCRICRSFFSLFVICQKTWTPCMHAWKRVVGNRMVIDWKHKVHAGLFLNWTSPETTITAEDSKVLCEPKTQTLEDWTSQLFECGWWLYHVRRLPLSHRLSYQQESFNEMPMVEGSKSAKIGARLREDMRISWHGCSIQSQ